jgi:hypothetical protein
MSARKDEIKVNVNENKDLNEMNQNLMKKIQLNLTQTLIISMKEQITP